MYSIYDTSSESSIDKIIIKRILCYNALNRKCLHGKNCTFAHSLMEQTKDKHREIAYDIIQNNNNLSNINLVQDKELYLTLKTLTHVCDNCIKEKCSGGYNCKFGAIDYIYQICEKDLIYGNCNIKCDKIHLTKRGLMPYNKQILDNDNVWKNIPKSVLTDKKNNTINKNINNIDMNIINGTLLTNSYFDDSDSISSESSNDIKQTIEYLNDNNSDIDDLSPEKSIFME